MKYRKSKWQKSFRKIPDILLSKTASIKSETIQVASVKSIPISDLKNGDYRHIGIYYEKNNLILEKQIMPAPTNGYASNYNQKTKVIIQKNLPKIDKIYRWDSPNFGDWSKGSHEVERKVKIYPKFYLEPLYLSILIEKLKETDKEIGFKFAINREINKKSENFELDLLRDINLLQENCGVSDIYDPKTNFIKYVSDLDLNWEILPVGTKDDILKSFFGKSTYTEQEKKEVSNRYEIISNLNPECYIKGTSGMQRYFGAKFNNKLVAFENLKYGNAIYVMQKNWASLSKLSRIELLKYHSGEIIRIVHRKGWERQFEYVIKKLKES
jgi:hypothetical protein